MNEKSEENASRRPEERKALVDAVEWISSRTTEQLSVLDAKSAARAVRDLRKTAADIEYTVFIRGTQSHHPKATVVVAGDSLEFGTRVRLMLADGSEVDAVVVPEREDAALTLVAP